VELECEKKNRKQEKQTKINQLTALPQTNSRTLVILTQEGSQQAAS
jgi:hypothetical protein